MHFSIPDTRLQTCGNQTFITYNIHINGTYHCSLRYRQLYQFYIQLRKIFGEKTLSEFPPKKIFQLSHFQLEERRSQLEKFLQIASQDSRIVQSRLFNGFLLAAQQESFENYYHLDNKNQKIINGHGSSNSNRKISSLFSSSSSHDAQNEQKSSSEIEIFQLNWHSTRLHVDSFENSDVVLSKFCRDLKLEPSHVPYFALFLVRRIHNDFYIVRPLESYESPLLTLKWINKLSSDSSSYSLSSSKILSSNNHSTPLPTSSSNFEFSSNNPFVIIVRKSYWNSLLDEDLFQERSSLNMLYWQALHEIEKGHVHASRDTRNKLTALQAKGDKIQYLRISRTLHHYGHIFFNECHCDYPAPNTPIFMCAGNFELCFKMANTQDEISFRVVRIKCWRLTSISQPKVENDNDNDAQISDKDMKNDENKEDSFLDNKFWQELELAFEYLVSKGELKWITIRSKQAVLLSLTLQSMVDEMLFQKSGKIRNKTDTSRAIHYNTSPSYSSQTNATLLKEKDEENDKKSDSKNETGSGNTQNGNLKLCQLYNDDWKFQKADGSCVSAKDFKLCDDPFVNGGKAIQIDNRRNRILYNANLVFNEILDEDL